MSVPVNVLRGAAIGAAEVVPGVSGGTIALVVGVYEILIGSAEAVVKGILALVVDSVRGRGTTRAREHLRLVRWGVVLPVLAGMVLAVLVGAALLEPFVVDHPEQSRALFAGMILVSLWVPLRLVGRWDVRTVLLAVVAAVAAFLLAGLPTLDPVDPPLPVVGIAAAVAICALVVPGVSGSYLLLAVGLYAPTLAAVNQRDFAYLGVFALGALVGLSSFVVLMQWLLEHHRRATLAVALGLMAGSLRALWPWQDADGGAAAPTSDGAATTALAFVVGAVIVAGALLLQSWHERRTATVAPVDA